MNRNTIIIIVVVVLILLLSALMLTIGLLIGGRDEGAGSLYALALRLYRDGEYERANMIVDEFLLDNPTHRRALALKTRIAERLAQLAADATSGDGRDGVADGDARDARRDGIGDGVAGGDSVASARSFDPAEQRAAATKRLSNIDNRDAETARRIERLLADGSALLLQQQTEQARRKFAQVLDLTLKDQAQSDAYDSIALARTAEAFRLDAKQDPQNYTRALSNITEAKELDANNWESYYVEGLIAIDRNQLDAAITALSTADRLAGDNADVLFALANAQYRKRLFDAAEGNYRKVLELVSNYRNAHHNLGVTLVRKGQTTAARQIFEQGIGYYANDPRLNYRLGIVNLDMGRLNSAERHLSIAVRENPQNAIYHGKLGDLYFNAYNISRARESYRRAVQLAPENPVLQYNLAVVSNITGDYATGKKAIDIALRADQSSAQYHYTHGQILDGLDRSNEALAAFQMAIAIDRNYPEAMSELGRLYVEAGDTAVGLRFLDRAHMLKPNSPEINTTIGNAYLSIKNYDQAITHLTTAINSRANDNAPRYNISLAYIELKQYSRALEQLQTILDADPNYWDAYLKIGVVHVARGDNELARMILNQLLQKNPNYSGIDEVKRILNNI